MTRPFEPHDLTDVAVTDALLDQLASGNSHAPAQRAGTEPLITLLTDWRAELDARAATALTADVPVLPSRSRRWVRTHRRTAAATAIVVVLAGSTTGVAAAASPSGPLGGLHKLFFGDSPSVAHQDARARMASDLLNRAAAGIRAAQRAGSITTARQAQLSKNLDSAQALLDADPQAPQPLQDELLRLRTDLAAIPVVDPTLPAAGENHGRSGHGADDTGTDDRGDGSGDTQSGGTSSGDHHDGGSSGSDDGTTTSGDGGSSGSGDGTSSSDGSGDQSSTSSDGGSTSGTDDSGTTSGGGDGGGDGGTTSGTDTSGSGSDSGGSGGGDLTSSTDVSGDGGGD